MVIGCFSLENTPSYKIVRCTVIMFFDGLIDEDPLLAEKVQLALKAQDMNDSSNPIAMVVTGILKSDPKEVSKTMTYDPEAEGANNPYANRLESLGVDNEYQDHITITDVPDNHFLAETGDVAPADGGNTRTISITIKPLAKSLCVHKDCVLTRLKNTMFVFILLE